MERRTRFIFAINFVNLALKLTQNDIAIAIAKGNCDDIGYFVVISGMKDGKSNHL
jgi:hypothetical protein